MTSDELKEVKIHLNGLFLQIQSAMTMLCQRLEEEIQKVEDLEEEVNEQEAEIEDLRNS